MWIILLFAGLFFQPVSVYDLAMANVRLSPAVPMSEVEIIGDDYGNHPG